MWSKWEKKKRQPECPSHPQRSKMLATSRYAALRPRAAITRGAPSRRVHALTPNDARPAR